MSNTAARKTNSEYSEILEKLQDVPTLPLIAVQVNQLIQDPNTSGAQIAEALKKDQVLTAKILRLANSSYYAIPGGVTDVQRALAFLGFNTVAQLVLGISVFSLFTKLGDDDFSMVDFWRHALATAVCSELWAKRLKYPKPEEAFTCGLLHDIGKLVLFQVDENRLKSIVREASKRSTSFTEVEREWDLPGHAFLGDVIATKWGLPMVLRLAIRYHHHDVSRLSTVLSSAKPVIQMVRLSNQMVVKNKIGKSGNYSDGKITSDMLLPLGITMQDVAAIEKELETGIEKAGAFLSAYR